MPRPQDRGACDARITPFSALGFCSMPTYRLFGDQEYLLESNPIVNMTRSYVAILHLFVSILFLLNRGRALHLVALELSAGSAAQADTRKARFAKRGCQKASGGQDHIGPCPPLK
jgi:hypothetical protein